MEKNLDSIFILGHCDWICKTSATFKAIKNKNISNTIENFDNLNISNV